MANTLIQLFHHVVFSTKHRQRLITPEIELRLYNYINGIASYLNSPCLAINGTEDHTHILVSLSKRIALSDFIRQVKSSSTRWMKAEPGGSHASFGWQDGFAAFSVGGSDVPAVIDYIRRQKEHHAQWSFEDEYRSLLRENNIDFDERYLFD